MFGRFASDGFCSKRSKMVKASQMCENSPSCFLWGIGTGRSVFKFRFWETLQPGNKTAQQVSSKDSKGKSKDYPLVMTNIAIVKIAHLRWIFPLKMVDFSIVMWQFTRGLCISHGLRCMIFVCNSSGLVHQWIRSFRYLLSFRWALRSRLQMTWDQKSFIFSMAVSSSTWYAHRILLLFYNCSHLFSHRSLSRTCKRSTWPVARIEGQIWAYGAGWIGFGNGLRKLPTVGFIHVFLWVEETNFRLI